MAASRAIFSESGWEKSGYESQSGPRRAKRAEGVEVDPANVDRAIRRARGRVRDIALANHLEYFVTLTLSPEEVDRYDMAAILKRMRTILDNQVRRHSLRYVLVAEHHKDGAVHFHGFMGWGTEPPQTVESGTMRPPKGGKPQRVPKSLWLKRSMAGWQMVHNLPWWNLGFSTALRIRGSYDATVSYVLKYISKESLGVDGRKLGGRWYYSGGQLRAPEVERLDIDPTDLARLPDAYCCEIREAGLSLVIWRGTLPRVKGGDTYARIQGAAAEAAAGRGQGPDRGELCSD